MNKEKIKIGDIVNIQFGRAPSIFRAEVLYMPFSTGDCWHLRTEDNQIIYVQNFEVIQLVEKKDKNE